MTSHYPATAEAPGREQGLYYQTQNAYPLSAARRNTTRRNRPMTNSVVAAKTRLCTRFVKGVCNSANCTFAHGDAELRKKPDLRKTKLCDAYSATKTCAKGSECTYAHGYNELQSSSEHFKAWKAGEMATGVESSGYGSAVRSAEGSPNSFFDSRTLAMDNPPSQHRQRHYRHDALLSGYEPSARVNYRPYSRRPQSFASDETYGDEAYRAPRSACLPSPSARGRGSKGPMQRSVWRPESSQESVRQSGGAGRGRYESFSARGARRGGMSTRHRKPGEDPQQLQESQDEDTIHVEYKPLAPVREMQSSEGAIQLRTNSPNVPAVGSPEILSPEPVTKFCHAGSSPGHDQINPVTGVGIGQNLSSIGVQSSSAIITSECTENPRMFVTAPPGIPTSFQVEMSKDLERPGGGNEDEEDNESEHDGVLTDEDGLSDRSTPKRLPAVRPEGRSCSVVYTNWASRPVSVESRRSSAIGADRWSMRAGSVFQAASRRASKQSVLCIDLSDSKPAAAEAYPLAALVGRHMDHQPRRRGTQAELSISSWSAKTPGRIENGRKPSIVTPSHRSSIDTGISVEAPSAARRPSRPMHDFGTEVVQGVPVSAMGDLRGLTVPGMPVNEDNSVAPLSQFATYVLPSYPPPTFDDCDARARLSLPAWSPQPFARGPYPISYSQVAEDYATYGSHPLFAVTGPGPGLAVVDFQTLVQARGFQATQFMPSPTEVKTRLAEPAYQPPPSDGKAEAGV